MTGLDKITLEMQMKMSETTKTLISRVQIDDEKKLLKRRFRRNSQRLQ